MIHDLPVPTLDHVVINVRDQIDAAETLYRRLGFHLTPRGFHTLGSINHLAIFGTDYLELIAVPPGSARSDILTYPTGLNGLVFAAEESGPIFSRLTEAGIPIGMPNDFSRPVTYEGGSGDAAFRTMHLVPGTFPAGRLYFCEHKTRHLVWRDEWRHHPNGVLGVACTTSVSADPQGMGTLLGRMFGTETVRTISGGVRLVMGLSSFDIVDAAEAARRYGATQETRADYMACLAFRVRDPDETGVVLSKAGIAFSRTGDSLMVPASETMGAVLVFQS